MKTLHTWLLFSGMAVAIAIVSLFSKIETLLMTPPTTPAQFLAAMPYLTFSLAGREYVLIQPSSTFLVYLLGALMPVVGAYFLVTQRRQNARAYWGIGLILWGLSAIVAGSSYQAFGYELKCRGYEYCLYTSNVELAYMLLTAYSINYLVAATGYTSLGERGRKWLLRFALLDSLAYTLYLFIGAFVPVKFLVSYEGFMLFIGGNFILMFVLNLRRYFQQRDRLNRNLIWVWLAFLGVNMGYFIYLFGGFAAPLYQNYGLWFNENDVLHVLLIAWSLLVFGLLKDTAVDTALV